MRQLNARMMYNPNWTGASGSIAYIAFLEEGLAILTKKEKALWTKTRFLVVDSFATLESKPQDFFKGYANSGVWHQHTNLCQLQNQLSYLINSPLELEWYIGPIKQERVATLVITPYNPTKSSETKLSLNIWKQMLELKFPDVDINTLKLVAQAIKLKESQFIVKEQLNWESIRLLVLAFNWRA
jgi:hypothetical protein